MTECKSCFDDITNAVKYRIHKKQQWHTSYYCETCVKYLIDNSWKIFTDQVKQADCKKALDKLVEVGPPINLRDRTGFPDPENKEQLTEIDELLFCSNNHIHTAKLKGSLTGQERIDYIHFLKSFKFT